MVTFEKIKQRRKKQGTQVSVPKTENGKISFAPSVFFYVLEKYFMFDPVSIIE